MIQWVKGPADKPEESNFRRKNPEGKKARTDYHPGSGGVWLLNSSTWKAEAGRSLNLRAAWSIK